MIPVSTVQEIENRLRPGRHERRGRHETPHPMFVITFPRPLSRTEAEKVKQAWLEARGIP